MALKDCSDQKLHSIYLSFMEESAGYYSRQVHVRNRASEIDRSLHLYLKDLIKVFSL